MIKKWRRNQRYLKTADTYLEQLPAELGLENLSEIADHYTRKIWKADSKQGPVCIKMYNGRQIPMAVRQVQLQETLISNGVRIPGHVHLDAPKSLGKKEWGCLIMNWIPGAKLDPTDPAQIKLAFQNLGRIHAIKPPSDLSPLFGEGKLADMEWQLKRNLHQYRRAGFPGIEDIEQRYIDKLLPMVESIHANKPPVGLIHFDYSHDNLLFGDDGELYTIDLDNIQPGVVVFDLAISLIHFFYGVRSEALTETPIAEVIEDPRFIEAVDAWTETAGPRAREVWEEYKRDLMLWAYIKASGNLATRTRDIVRFSAEERAELRARAEKRLAILTDYINRGDHWKVQLFIAMASSRWFVEGSPIPFC